MLTVLIARPSPFARKVRMVLREKGIAHREEVENPWLPGAGLGAHNPLAKVPVLVRGDGPPLYDSRVIVEYLEQIAPRPALLPAEPAARIAHRQLEALADGICDAVVLLVLERARPIDRQSADWVDRQRAKVENGCAALERALGDGTWFIGGGFGLADICAGCALGYLDLRLPDFDWRAHHPALTRFLATIEARESYRATRPEAQSVPAQK